MVAASYLSVIEHRHPILTSPWLRPCGLTVLCLLELLASVAEMDAPCVGGLGGGVIKVAEGAGAHEGVPHELNRGALPLLTLRAAVNGMEDSSLLICRISTRSHVCGNVMSCPPPLWPRRDVSDEDSVRP
jgi:hypothetical protein